jgi:hypothetical protein
MATEIKTNRHWREFVYRWEVPEDVLRDEFDWTDEDTIDGFFCYRGFWYHLSQFVLVPEQSELSEWHGIHHDSFFSGVVVKVSNDGERYRVGTVIATSGT